jgi:hypothetical protein
MAFNVSTFRNSLAYDGARPNLFEVVLTGVPALGGQLSLEDFTFKCKSAQIPGSTLGVVTVPYFGREVKFVGNRTFADWTVTVINDEDFKVRKFFERWMNVINSHETNTRGSGFTQPNSYVGQAVVKQYTKTGQSPTNLQYSFVDIFPTDLSAIDLDWGSNDTIEEFTVNFTYQYWTSSVTPSSGQAVQVQNAQPDGADLNNGATRGAAEALARAR